MSVYVVLLFDLDDAVVVSADTVEAGGRDSARAKADDLLRNTPDADGYELWLDGVRVGAWFPGDTAGHGNGHR